MNIIFSEQPTGGISWLYQNYKKKIGKLFELDIFFKIVFPLCDEQQASYSVAEE